LPYVHGVIDVTQIHMQKPRSPFVRYSNPKFTSCSCNLWFFVVRSLEMFYGHVLFNERGIDIVPIKLVLEDCDQGLVSIQQR